MVFSWSPQGPVPQLGLYSAAVQLGGGIVHACSAHGAQVCTPLTGEKVPDTEWSRCRCHADVTITLY